MQVTTKYYLFVALFNLGFAGTFVAYGPFLRSIGLSLGEIGILNTIFWVVLIASEIPTGLLADGRSRAWSLKAGAFTFALGALAYFFASGFWSAALAEALVGIGGAFLSGAQQAWITDALERAGKSNERRKVFATESAVRSAVIIVGGMAGPLLAVHSYKYIWLPLIVTGILTSLFVHFKMNGAGEPLTRVDERAAFALALAHLKRSRELKWLIAVVFLFGTVVVFNHYWSIYFKEQVGLFGVSFIWPILYGSVFVSGLVIRKIKVPQGQEGKLIILSTVLAGLGLLGVGFVQGTIFPIGIIMIHEFGRGMSEPLMGSYVQHRVESSYRATFGSLQSLLGRSGCALAPLIVWLTIGGKPNNQETISTVWMWAGAVLIVGAIFLYVIRPKPSQT
ncbi:MAG: MFS transporter [Patescibacteria group bacterium]